MTVSLADTRTEPDQADSTTGWTATNGPTLTTADPDPVEATGSLGMVVSNATEDLYFGISSANLSDTLVYVWGLGNGVMDTLVNGGLAVLLYDGTDRIGFHVAGNDKAVFRHADGPVNWQCMAIDTTNLPSNATARAGVVGDLTLTALTGIGAMYTTTLKAVGGVDNCFTDVIRYGLLGLIVTAGTSGAVGTFLEIATADRSTADAQAFGIFRELGTGLYGMQGPLTFGDTGTGNSYFKDADAVVNFEDYGFSAGRYFIDVVGGTGSTHFELGVKVGTAGGTQGVTWIAPAGQGAAFDATDTDLDDLLLYGGSFVNFEQGLSFSADATNGPTHEVIGYIFRACGQVAAGRVEMKGNTFDGYVQAEGGALLWNANIDIEDSIFTGCSEGVEHATAGTFTYTGLTFSANTADVNNSSDATNEIALAFAGIDGTIDLDDTNNGAAQSFTLGGSNRELSSGAMELDAVGSPTGNVQMHVYADSGGLPTGAALASSQIIAATAIPTSPATVDFSFNNDGQIELVASTTYHLAVEYSGGTATDYITVGVDSGGGLSGSSSILNGSWASGGTPDVPIEVRYDGIVTINASGGSDPTIAVNTGTPPGCVVIVNTKTLEITVTDAAAVPIPYANVRITDSSDDSLISEGTANDVGVYTDSTYNYVSDVSVNVDVRKSSPGAQRYEARVAPGTIDVNGLTLTVALAEDDNAALVAPAGILRQGFQSEDESGNAVQTITIDLPEGTSRKLIVGAMYYDSATNLTVSSITYDGNAMTNIAGASTFEQEGAGNFHEIATYYYDVPDADEGDKAVVVTWSANVALKAMAFAVIDDAATGAVDDSGVNTGDQVTSNPSVSVNNTAASWSVVFSIVDDTDSPSATGVAIIRRSDLTVDRLKMGALLTADRTTTGAHSLGADYGANSKTWVAGGVTVLKN